MRGVRRLLLSSIAFLVMAFLSPPPLDAQEHPFELEPSVKANFERYMRKGNRGAFALSEDGRASAYSFCSLGAMCAWGQRHKFERLALQTCQRRSGQVPCKIYAWRGNIVWDGEAPRTTRSASAKHSRCDRDEQRSLVSEETVGWGNLTLSSKIFDAYQTFRSREGTGYFYLSMSGRAYGYQFCEYEDCDFGFCRVKAQEGCEKHSLVSCFMLADKTGVVWDGEVRGPGGRSLPGANPD